MRIIPTVVPLLALLSACASDDLDGTQGPRVLDDFADEDGDGLTNLEEQEGWVIAVNVTGYGDDFQSVTVSSDPLVADTDGDGLSDLEERLYRSDPRLVDTDGDGLGDESEVFRWFTSPTHVDTDEDSRGTDPDFLQPPLLALFDGNELSLELRDGRLTPAVGATSPSLDDTDGDGRSDYDELQSARNDPAVAELPEFAVAISPGTSVDLSLDVVYSGSTTEAESFESRVAVSSGLTEETGASASVGLYYDISNKTTVDTETKVGCCATLVSTGGSIDNETRNTFRINTSYTASYNRESSRSSHQEWTDYTTSTVNTSHSVEAARVQTQVDLANTGTRSINVGNLSFLAYAVDGHTVRPFASMRPPVDIVGGLPQLPTYTLAPGERLAGVILSDFEADAGRVAEVMKDPHRVLLSAGTYTLSDATGLDYDFQQDLVNERTTRLTIDWGPGNVEHLDVASNVDRHEDGTTAGMTVRSALDLAGVHYAYEQVGENYFYTLDDRPTVLHEGPAPDLAALYADPGYTVEPGARAVRSNWTVFIERYDGSDSSEEVYTDWSHAVVYPGDIVVLVYASDNDQDGIVDREEALFGSSDLQADTDEDGLSDYWEIRESWTVDADRIPLHQAYASPTEADRDNDGLIDIEEWVLGTNPARRDTDGDGFPDGAEVTSDLGQSPLEWDEPSGMQVCCQLESTGRAYMVSVIDDDSDARSFVFHPGNATPTQSQGFDLERDGTVWTAFFVPRPIFWDSWVEAFDELGQRAVAECPWPGIDPPNAYGCPTHPHPGDFDSIGGAW